MANYPSWTVEQLTRRWLDWRHRLLRAKNREELLSIWGEIEVLEKEIDRRLFDRTE